MENSTENPSMLWD